LIKPETIKKDIYWVGAQNPDLRVFDVIMCTKWGTSYNSYLVRGSKKTALIDAVKERYCDEHIARISSICDPAEIDYIIINHTEPDHSGSLRKLLEVTPNAKVVSSKVANGFLQQIVNQPFESIVVGDGDELDLGGKTLQFINAPFLHWPDSMFTYVKEDKILLSGDVFGFHFSAEKVFDDLTPLSKEMVESQKYYFDVIMSSFSEYVLSAVEKIKDLPVDVIGPSHGPVLRANPHEAIVRYKKWAEDVVRPNAVKKIYIGYVSCYGYTKQLAEKIYDACAKSDFSVEMDDLSMISTQEAAEKMHAADAVAIGSPTVNRDALKPVWDVLTSVSYFNAKGKKAACFGSYGWSGEGVKFTGERMKSLGYSVQGSLAVRFRPTDEDLNKAYELGETLVKSIS